MRRQFDIGVDMGSANVVAVAPGRGVIICEPSVVAVEVSTGYAAGWGTRALDMLAHDPARYRMVAAGPWGDSSRRPLALYVLSAVVHAVCGVRRVSGPRAALLAPASPSVLDIRAMYRLAVDAGLTPTTIVQSPVAISVGVGALDRDVLVADVGAERTHIAVIQLGAAVWSWRERAGMSGADRRLQQSIREELGVRVGISEARRVREARNRPGWGGCSMRARGYHVGTCLPADADVPAAMVDEAVDGLADLVGHTLRAARLRWAGDDVILAGGGALQHLFAARVAEVAGSACSVADDPQLAAARGLLHVAEYGIPRVTNAAVCV